MLHIPSYNMGLAAGHVAKAAGVPRPSLITEIPGMEAILDASKDLNMFFPSSFAEGYVMAYDNPSYTMAA